MLLTVKEIMSMVGSEVDSRHLNETNVATQCFYVLGKIGHDVIGELVRNEPFAVKNGILNLPPKVLQLKSVSWSGNSSSGYNYDPLSKKLEFPFDVGQVEVTYWGVRLDEDGMPLIPEVATEACVKYIKHRFNESKTLGGTAREKRDALATLQYTEQMWREEVQAVRGSINLQRYTKDRVRNLNERQKRIYRTE